MSTFDYTYEQRQRDINAGLYVPFYIEAPIEDLEVTIGTEEQTEDVILVDCVVVDPGGDAIEEIMKVRMVLFTDDAYDTVATAFTTTNITAPTGQILHVNTTDVDIDFLTDDAGELQLSFEDASGSGDSTEDRYLGFILPNGKFVEGGQVAFTHT